MENLDKGILEIERLVKAQDGAALLYAVSFDEDGAEFFYKIDSGPNGRTIGELRQPPRPARLSLTTLTGFLDAVAILKPGAGHLVHVEDYLTVSLRPASADRYGVRDTLVEAKHIPIDAFDFDTFYDDPAEFIIALQVAFLQTEELLYLIRVASNLKAGNSVNTQDDGFSQTVILRTGEVSTAEVQIKPRIKLIPIRTFSEASPVESEFLIRFQQSHTQAPSIALYTVDGNKWKGETMLSIKKHLEKHLPKDLPVVA